jgi:hypothetical protein
MHFPYNYFNSPHTLEKVVYYFPSEFGMPKQKDFMGHGKSPKQSLKEKRFLNP